MIWRKRARSSSENCCATRATRARSSEEICNSAESSPATFATTALRRKRTNCLAKCAGFCPSVIRRSRIFTESWLELRCTVAIRSSMTSDPSVPARPLTSSPRSVVPQHAMAWSIACCGTTLRGELVRGLAGTVGSEVMEDLMATVQRSSSQDALKILDRLMTEGQNPAHFAKQFVRFLRNAVVAKVAGEDSGLLQISSDERARVARVAQQFSEEDLARFLQIMLRTFDELGYRQEQRYHLELGVLKLVHAQRILPLEQMLGQVAADTPKASAGQRPPAVLSAAPVGAPAGSSSTRKQEAFTSPFEADRARKGRSFDPEMSDAGPQIESSSSAAASSVTPAFSQPASTLTSGATAGVAIAVADGEPDPDSSTQASDDPAEILGHVVLLLEDIDNNLSAVLAPGAATIQGNELIVAIDQPASIVPFIMNEKYKPMVNKAASDAAGRPLKVKLVGGAPKSAAANIVRPPRTNGNGIGQSARARAANDPIVRRMQEKFGADIRTVIDQTQKD